MTRLTRQHTPEASGGTAVRVKRETAQRERALFFPGPCCLICSFAACHMHVPIFAPFNLAVIRKDVPTSRSRPVFVI